MTLDTKVGQVRPSLSLIPVPVTGDPASPRLWAEKSLFAAQTRVGWIPVTGTGMRVEGRCSMSQSPLAPPDAAGEHRGDLAFAFPEARRIRRSHVEDDLRATATRRCGDTQSPIRTAL